MILQALANYYKRLIEMCVPEIEHEGYKRVEIPFVIVIDNEGKLQGINDTRSGEGKNRRGRNFIVPKVFEGSRTSNVKANLLWDKASYVFGIGPNTKPKRLIDQQQMFRNTINEYFPDNESAKHVKAVVLFLDSNCAAIKDYREWKEISTTDPNIAFMLQGTTELVCNTDEVIESIKSRTNFSNHAKGVCLISGKVENLVRLENPIKGLRGSGKAESHWVAFNDAAYLSYGKANVPIGKPSSFSYVSALNYLQNNDSRQLLIIGGTTTVFWAEHKNTFEDTFATLFGEPSKENPNLMNKAILALYASPQLGAPPLFDKDYTPFFVLGLAPNAARIAVRFWHAGTVGETAHSIRQHFDDCDIIHGPNQPEHLSLFRMLVSTAVQGKMENIQPKLAGDFMKAILTATPYPKTLLASVISRIRAEQSGKDKNGKSVQNVSYPRAALIKACLVRETRYYKQHEREVSMALDINNMNIGYRLGRLFAVLEKIQEEANPGINATIRDRFYGSASSTPIAAFPTLMRLKNHHLAKLENRGRAVNLEKLIGEIMYDVADFPTHLSLQDQGRFAVGYYHQRQNLFPK